MVRQEPDREMRNPINEQRRPIDLRCSFVHLYPNSEFFHTKVLAGKVGVMQI